jgi:UDP-glucose 6-dehydrogenase
MGKCERKVYMKVTVVGNGWVGKAMMSLFPDAFMYSNHEIIDWNGTLIDIPTGDVKEYQEEANKGDIAFICVPTPNIIFDEKRPGSTLRKGRLDTMAVEEVVAWCTCPLLVIRSTVNPGTTDFLIKKYHKRILMQPEYLGETPNHPMSDQKARPFLIIGGDPKDVRSLIDLYGTVYNANVTIRKVTAYESEVIKLTENRAIAFKVAQCQEMYDACEASGTDYYTIRDAVYGDDPRFNLWWTMIYPGKRGFNSKCIPKDIYAWVVWAETAGVDPKITKAILSKNEEWIT